MSNKIEETVLLAIKYIAESNQKEMKPYIKTIKSFISGAKSSPFYDFYHSHSDVCGKFPNIEFDTILKTLDDLERKEMISKEINKKGKICYNLSVKNKHSVSNSIPTSHLKTDTNFYDSANEEEKKVLNKFKKLVFVLLPDHSLQNNKSTFGFAPNVYEGDFPRKRCWISRDSKAKTLVLKYKKETTSTEKVLPLKTEKQINEAFRQLRVSYNTAVNDIEIIVNRIKNKDSFDDYKTENLKDIELMPHQKAGVELADKYDRFAFFYDTGTGKTIMTLEIIMRKHLKYNARFLIVAPKSLIKNAWMDDSKHFKGMKLLPLSKNIKREDYLRIYDDWEELDGKKRLFTDKDGNLLETYNDWLSADYSLFSETGFNYSTDNLVSNLKNRADHFIINIDVIREAKKGNTLLKELKCDGLVIDESVIIKNRESQNSVRMRVFAKKMKYVYLLSGKPAPNSTVEYFSQMEIVDPETFGISYGSFVNMYYKHVGFGKLVDKNDSTRKEVARMVGNRSIIIQKEDCIKLPPAIHQKITVELDQKTADFYSDIIKRFITEIVDMNGKKIKVRPLSKLASIMKLREVASGFYLDQDNSFQINRHKVDAINDLIEEIGYDKSGKYNKILIWCTFKYEIKTLEKELQQKGYKVVTAYSETKDVASSVDEFQKGDADVLIAHPQTLKYGVTLTNCHYCIYSSMSYSYDDYKQSHDRIYRNGQKELCVFYHVLSEDTIDENIYKIVVDKANRSKIFEALVKSASKYGIKKETIENALNANVEIRHEVVNEKQLDGYISI